jgi:hypothetical protein
MPLLSRNADLDKYDPNSIISASKKIATISLSNIKNSSQNPDMAINSMINASSQTKANTSEYFAGLNSAIAFFKLLNVVKGAGRKNMFGGMPLKGQRRGRDGRYYPFLGSDGNIYKDGDNIPEGITRSPVARDYWIQRDRENPR